MERVYIIPLRKEFQKAPVYKQTKKAVQAVREFMQRHMKNEQVKLGQHLNHALTARGRKNPPHKVKVKAWTETIKKDNKDIEIVKVELFGAPEEKKIEEAKPEKIEEKIEQIEKKEDKQEKAKEEVLKEEKKPLEKNQPKAAAPAPEDKKPHDSKKTTRAAPHHSQHTVEKKK